MARITVEDCVKNFENRFELVLVAAKRARQLLENAATPLVPIDNDKSVVVALREIAENLISREPLIESNSVAHLESDKISVESDDSDSN